MVRKEGIGMAGKSIFKSIIAQLLWIIIFTLHCSILVLSADDYSTGLDDNAIAIEMEEELLGTVSPSEFGYDNISIEKMRADVISYRKGRYFLGADELEDWTDKIADQAAKEKLMDKIETIKAGEGTAIPCDYTIEAYSINLKYSNFPSLVNRTRISIIIVPSKDLTNTKILAYLPEILAKNAPKLIHPQETPLIIAQDSVMEWTIPLIRAGESKKISFYTDILIPEDSLRLVAFEKHTTDPIAVITIPESISSVANFTNSTDGILASAYQDKDVDSGISELPSIDKREIVINLVPMLWPLSILFLLLALVALAVFIYKRIVASRRSKTMNLKLIPGERVISVRPNVTLPYALLKDSEKFMLTRMRQGHDDSYIKKSLINAGWEPIAVDIVLHDVHILNDNFDSLNHYIEACLARKLGKTDIIANLSGAGWRIDLIELLLDKIS